MEKYKILVVDDESRMRKLVRDFLVKKDFEVIEAGDGAEALDLFFEDKDISLVILDVMMPKMDGWQVCREIRAYSKVPIIMLTAKGEERDELLGFELGVDEYISKPFTFYLVVYGYVIIFEVRCHFSVMLLFNCPSNAGEGYVPIIGNFPDLFNSAVFHFYHLFWRLSFAYRKYESRLCIL